jgi:hypothetical protein
MLAHSGWPYLEEIAAAAAGEAVEVESGGEAVTGPAWEAQMGLHHVAEVGQRIVEFIVDNE